eukprot:TRINITY_DN7213_c0_g1_i1.p1 TRINITY_DN7213_c0_g1~~TRINITY_DN7213_c0_g1_i1.p1  ORF type:complete len:377 (+),score=118.40 TRINITY_DN7213_c0_g1_i1:157-1287(+)
MILRLDRPGVDAHKHLKDLELRERTLIEQGDARVVQLRALAQQQQFLTDLLMHIKSRDKAHKRELLEQRRKLLEEQEGLLLRMAITQQLLRSLDAEISELQAACSECEKEAAGAGLLDAVPCPSGSRVDGSVRQDCSKRPTRPQEAPASPKRRRCRQEKSRKQHRQHRQHEQRPRQRQEPPEPQADATLLQKGQQEDSPLQQARQQEEEPSEEEEELLQPERKQESMQREFQAAEMKLEELLKRQDDELPQQHDKQEEMHREQEEHVQQLLFQQPQLQQEQESQQSQQWQQDYWQQAQAGVLQMQHLSVQRKGAAESPADVPAPAPARKPTEWDRARGWKGTLKKVSSSCRDYRGCHGFRKHYRWSNLSRSRQPTN